MARTWIPAACLVAVLVCSSTLAGLDTVQHADTTIHPAANIENTLETYDLLIISPAAWTDHLQRLKEHKDSHGIATRLVTLDEIYGGDHFSVEGRDDQEKIKYFIKNALEDWNISYVMLVGGRHPALRGEPWWLPARYSHIEDNVATEEDTYLSDLYYADIYTANGSFSSWDTDRDGIYGEWRKNQPAEDIRDLHPDVYLGRLACRNTREVQTMVDKIITYETTVHGAPWLDTFATVAGDTYTFNDYNEGEIAAQQAIDRMPHTTPINLWTSDHTLQGWRDVAATLQQGCGYIFFAGHGSPTTWGTHPPNDPDTWIYGLQTFQMPLLNNGDRLPICVVAGCHNSLFNVSLTNPSWTFGIPVYECWSWRLTSLPRGGAIATLGSTGLGYSKEDKFHPEQGGAGDWLDILFFDAIGQQNIDILGQAWSHAV
ncbi:MAG: C25 family cysteine peptidase, partial [Thermoplasmatota archaeon]